MMRIPLCLCMPVVGGQDVGQGTHLSWDQPCHTFVPWPCTSPSISVPQLLLLHWSSADCFVPICGDRGCLKSILWPHAAQTFSTQAKPELAARPFSTQARGVTPSPLCQLPTPKATCALKQRSRACESQACWLAGETLSGCVPSLHQFGLYQCSSDVDPQFLPLPQFLSPGGWGK